MSRRPPSPTTRRALAVLAAALLSACGGDLPEPAVDASAGPAEEPADGAMQATEPRTGTLTVQGDPLAAPGDYRLRTSCSYARGEGSFSFGMHPEPDARIERGAATFGVRAGWGPGVSVPLEDGTYEAEFEYEEVAGDGTVPSYLGSAEMTLRIVDDTRAGFPVVDVQATGTGEGVRFEAHGRCQAMVMG